MTALVNEGGRAGLAYYNDAGSISGIKLSLAPPANSSFGRAVYGRSGIAPTLARAIAGSQNCAGRLAFRGRADARLRSRDLRRRTRMTAALEGSSYKIGDLHCLAAAYPSSFDGIFSQSRAAGGETREPISHCLPACTHRNTAIYCAGPRRARTTYRTYGSCGHRLRCRLRSAFSSEPCSVQSNTSVAGDPRPDRRRRTSMSFVGQTKGISLSDGSIA